MGNQTRLSKWLGFDADNHAKTFFVESNIRSCQFVSIIVFILSAFMVTSALAEYRLSSIPVSTLKINIYFIAFILVILASIFVFIVSKRYSSGKPIGHERDIITAYSALCVSFGMYVSAIDYRHNSQIFVFMIMIILISCFLVWRPVISLITDTLAFGIFYFLMAINGGINPPNTFRYLILWIAVIVTSVSIYNHKHEEAKKDAKVTEVDTKLTKTTNMDNVTGVANMDFFSKRAKEVLYEHKSHPGSKVFLFLDIENFKVINSRYGYASGNAFLAKVAGMMTDMFPDALIARQGDDHFVILTERKGAKQKVESLRLSIYNFNPEIQIGLKVGAYVPHSADCNPNHACDNARIACQQIKKRYDQDYCEYDNVMNDEYSLKQYIVNNVDTALDRGDIRVYYQPVVWARNGKVCGYEALVKWKDPEHGFLSPGLFIPVLEEYRQVHKVDMIVVDTVFRDIRKLLDEKKPVAPVSLNFSRLDFELTDVVDLLESCASTYSVSREYIHVEVTESALSDNLDSLKDDLVKLKKLGYPLWLDDFGSGYSSLNVLKDFDFDVMKIDMVFLSAFNEKTEKTKAVLKNVVNMASDLGMHTLTEGVETKEEYEYLRDIGCERLQGYLFGKPMPLEEIMVKISAGTLPVSEEYINA